MGAGEKNKEVKFLKGKVKGLNLGPGGTKQKVPAGRAPAGSSSAVRVHGKPATGAKAAGPSSSAAAVAPDAPPAPLELQPNPKPPRGLWPREVKFLATHSIPSSSLPELLATIYCAEPDPLDPHHPAQVAAHDWTFTARIDESTHAVPSTSKAKLSTFSKGAKSNWQAPPAHSHPAMGQMGLFAKRAIPAKTLVIPYLGLVHTDEESDERSVYDLRIVHTAEGEGHEEGETRVLGIDATTCGNEARFVNDYRNIMPRQNVWFEEYEAVAKRPDEEEERGEGQGASGVASSSAPEGEPRRKVRGLGFFTGSKGIPAGMEICTSYGKGFWKERERLEGGEVEGEDEVAKADGAAQA